MSENGYERYCRAEADNDYFYEVLHVLFYRDDDCAKNVTELNMDMFGDFCSHVRSTYQNLFNGAEDPHQYMEFVKPYMTLKEIALFPEFIDYEHDVLRTFAEQACDAIEMIKYDFIPENQLTILSNRIYNDIDDDCMFVVLYDFEKDTPEDVWNRVEWYLSAGGSEEK